MKTRALVPFCALLLLTLPGCSGCFLFGRDDSPPLVRTTTAREPIAPRITGLSIPSWPPVGPNTAISASASDEDGNLSSITFDFKDTATRNTSGSSFTASVFGWELGEGYGSLYVTAFDRDGGWADQKVNNFLVDLSTPKGELVTNVVRWGEGRDLAVWVGDGWVLGGVQLTFGEVSRDFVFEEGYPSTLGSAWDTSVVTFATKDFPEITGTAKLRVWDAAGNETTTELELTLDGTPPIAVIDSPAAGSTLSGLVTIEVSGGDETPEPVEIDVFVAGTPVATLPGPSGQVTVDLSEIAKGPVQIEAIARDVAGNESEAAVIDVVIE